MSSVKPVLHKLSVLKLCPNMELLVVNKEWSNFPPYFHKAYRVIDIDKDIPDVTLACDDGALDAQTYSGC